jgi:endonuclease/exonuclease/phosphatase family metal-dependent hydrolase
MRIATFNLENLDDKPGQKPTLKERIVVMRPQLERLDADILCLQEIHGQETPNEPRDLLALKELIKGTKYENYHVATTKKVDGTEAYDERNLVVLSRYEITKVEQFKNDHIEAPEYKKLTANPPEDSKNIGWERPILYTKVKIEDGKFIHVINLHLKSKIPTNITGQKLNNYTWRTATAWAEGYFISSMKRVGQALETRVLVDKIFDENEDSYIVVCGDFNADSDSVPVAAIRGDVENTGNGKLANRVLLPCENSIPESSRYTLLHEGKGEMIDHLLISRNLLSFYKGSEIHNELLHDESISFATDKKYPEPDHAPIVASFSL